MIASLLLNTITVNQVLSTGAGYALTRESGLSLPPIRTASFNLAGVNFGAHVASFYGIRAFALDILVIGTSFSDFQSKRAALLSAIDPLQGEIPLVFTLSDGTTRTLTAITTSCDFSLQAGIPTAAECHIEFEAAFPFFLGATTTTTFGLPTIGGAAVPGSVPGSLSMGSGGAVTVINNGTAPAYPTFVFTGPLTNPAVRNETTGDELRFELTLASGQALTVDGLLKEITDSSGMNRYSSKSGDWWTIQPGANVLSFRADSSDPATLQARFADTYLALA